MPAAPRRSARIHVCGLDEMPRVVASAGPARLISMLPEYAQPATPGSVAAADHLRLLVDDVDAPKRGYDVPSRDHVDELIAFLRASDREASIVIHCLAGVSRSTAAALVALTVDAPGREHEAAALLRRTAPAADPNRRIVELADRALGRAGELVAAREAMGLAARPDYAPVALPRWL